MADEWVDNLKPIIIKNEFGREENYTINIDENVELSVRACDIVEDAELPVEEYIVDICIELSDRSRKSAHIVADLTVYEWCQETRTRKIICERRYDRIHRPGRCFNLGDGVKLCDYDERERNENKFIIKFTDFQITYI